MKLIRELNKLPSELCGGAVTIGNFDGVHRGHARIVQRLIHQARKVSGPATVFTFDPHPVRLLRPKQAPPPLTWTDRKAELLAELGVDVVIAYPTDERLLALSPHEFFELVVGRQLHARAMVEGPNFFFGRDRTGTIDVLQELCGQHDVIIEVVQPLRHGRQFISSSRIRTAIRNGHVAEARQLLTQPYRIRGMVTHGVARGARIGFPTANLNAIDTLLPAHGVYAGRAKVEQQYFPAAINIGPNPTFGECVEKLEVHLIGFDGSLYGQALEVDFLARLRDIQSFPGTHELINQLRHDVEAVRGMVDVEYEEYGK